MFLFVFDGRLIQQRTCHIFRYSLLYLRKTCDDLFCGGWDLIFIKKAVFWTFRIYFFKLWHFHFWKFHSSLLPHNCLSSHLSICHIWKLFYQVKIWIITLLLKGFVPVLDFITWTQTFLIPRVHGFKCWLVIFAVSWIWR